MLVWEFKISNYRKEHKKCDGKIRVTAYGNYLCEDCWELVEKEEVRLTFKGQEMKPETSSQFDLFRFRF